MKNRDDSAANFLSIPDLDEATITTARRREEDELLDLGTLPPELKSSGNEHGDPSVQGKPDADLIANGNSETLDLEHQPVEINSSGAGESAASRGSVAFAAGALALGAILGLLAYHYLLRPAESSSPAPSSTPSANQPLSAFEDLRREVESDPGLFLLKNPQPEDAEDYYLTGRAHVLLGDYPKARAAFLEAKKLLPGEDPANARVLATDLAIIMSIMNDTAVQTALRSEINAVRPAADPNSNTNR